MATNAISDYSARDFSALVESLLDVAALRLPEWTDRSENDLGRMLLELFAYVGDTILYYQDRIANEAFLQTAVERGSVIDLLSLIGYTLATPVPAAVELELTPPAGSGTVQVDFGATFATKAGGGKPSIEFSYLPATGAPLIQAPVPLASGGFQPLKLTAINATRVPPTGLGQSSGFENQGFAIPNRPVLVSRDPDVWDGLLVEVQSGGVWERWQRRATLLYSRSDDPHFTVRVDEEDEAEIIFGDGTYGRIPPLNAPVRATYLTGGGAEGNVAPGTVSVIASGVNVQATVTNPAGASGGADRETIEHARRHAPGVFRSQQRAVTESDFVHLAESFEGVARAVAVAPRWDHTIPPGTTTATQADAGLVTWNYVDLLVVAEGGLVLTDALRARLLQFLESRRMVTTIVHVRAPVFVSVDLTVRIGVEPTFFAADVAQRARERLEALFRLDEADFGKAVYLSKVFEAAEAADGVAFAEVLFFRGRRSYPPNEVVGPAATVAAGRIPLRPREFPRRGAIVVQTEGGLS